MWVVFHCPFNSENSPIIPCPTASSNSIVYIPKEHAFQTSLRVLTTIKNHSEASIYDLAPANSPTVVDAYPGSSAEAVAYNVLNRHVCREPASVINIGRFAIRRICSRNIMMITPQDNWANFSF